MKKEAVYESHISTGRWLVYDVPGNVGWIMYLVCLIRCFVIQPVCMEIPLVSISLMVGIVDTTNQAGSIVYSSASGFFIFNVMRSMHEDKEESTPSGKQRVLHGNLSYTIRSSRSCPWLYQEE